MEQQNFPIFRLNAMGMENAKIVKIVDVIQDSLVFIVINV